MANSKRDKDAIGLSALMLTVAIITLVAATSVAVGFTFGTSWGFVTLGAWALLFAVVLSCVILRMVANDGRNDG